MNDTATGWLGYVTSETLGSETSADANSGDSELTVADVSDFLGGGGWVDVDQAGDPFEYTDATLNDDGTTGVLTLAANLTDDVATGSRVDLWDVDADEAYLEYFAGVTFPGDSGPTKCHLPGSLAPLFRDQAGVSVDVEEEEDGWWVKRPRSQKPRANLGLASDDPIHPPAVTNAWEQNPDDFAATAHPAFLRDGPMTAHIDVVGSLRSGGNGTGQTNMHPGGFVTRKSTGETVSLYSNDDLQPDVHRGRAELSELVASGEVFLDGQVDIGQGSIIQLRSTTIPPAVSPTGDEDWPAADGDFGGYSASLREGLAMVSATEAYTLQRVAEVPGYDPKVIVGVNPAEGAGDLLGVYTFSGGAAGINRCNITYSALNDKLVTIGTTGSAWIVEYWDMPSGDTVAFSSSWTWTQGEHPARARGVLPAITCVTSGGQDKIVIAQTHKGDGKIRIRQYLDGVLSTTINTTAVFNFGDLAGVALLATGLTVAVVADGANPYRDADGNVAMPLITLSTGATSTTEVPIGFANSSAAGISCLDGDTSTSRIWYVSKSSDQIIQHSNPAVHGNLYLAGAWGDSASGGVTKRSDLVYVTKRPGTRIGVVLSALPRGVDSGLLYAAISNTPPLDAVMHAQNSPLVASSSVFVQIFDLDTTGPTPVAVSTFPGGAETVSKIVDATGATLVDSSGYVAGGGGGGADLDDDMYIDEDTGDIYFEAAL